MLPYLRLKKSQAELALEFQDARRHRTGRRFTAEEQAVAEAYDDSVTLEQAHLVDAACGHEQHVQVCRWLLRERIGKMSTADVRECSRQMAAARDSRNRAVMQLKLDRDKLHDAIDALYSRPTDNGGDDEAAA